MKSSVLLLTACIFTAGTVDGQTTLNATAGADQVYSAYGLQTAYTWHNLSGWTGVGYNNGVRAGGYLKIPVRKNESGEYHLDLGDQTLPAFLDTDEYDSHNFSVRGVGVSHNTSVTHTQMFSGVLLQESMLPFMHTGNIIQTPLAAMIVSRQLSKTFQLHSLAIYDGKVTSIESFGWVPSKGWRLSGAGGMGAGAGYLAAAGEYNQKRMDVRASYISAGKGFQRQEQPYYSTELIGANARASLTPIDALNLAGYHEKSRTNIVGFPSVTGTVDSATLSTLLKGFRISPSVSRMTIEGTSGSNLTESISATRSITPWWRVFGSYINMDSPLFKQQTEVMINEFKISSRLSLLQNFGRMEGQNTYSFGGQWVSNFVSLSVDQQTYISPLATAFGGKPIFQAWTFNIRLRTPHGTNVNLNTIVAPNGKVQWGGNLSGLRYSSIGPQHDDSPSFSKYSVEGVVNDEATGKGVAGIAVQIGKDTVLSNESGVFYLDVKNRKAVALRVARELSVQPLHWELASAPSEAEGTMADATVPVRISVRMASSFVDSGRK